jgi:hypothetical protein
MIRISTICFVFIVMLASPCYSQSLPWKQSSKWYIYKVVDRKAIFAPGDSLASFAKLKLGNDSLAYYLDDASPLKATAAPAWMGAYLLSFEQMQGKPIKLLVSTYGGFILDTKHKLYYLVQEGKQQAWLAYVGNQYERFINEPE